MAKEAEVITIDSDDETPGPSTSSGMASLQAPSAQPRNQTANTNGASASPNAKHPNQAFFLFCRDNKKLVSTKYPNLNMEELKRKYVEMWRALPEIKKCEYKRRVSNVGPSATKTMKTKMPPLVDSRHQPRRSAGITGFSVFSMEFRKTLNHSVSLQEAFRKAEEAWLTTPKRVQYQYEQKAARLGNGVGCVITPAASRPSNLTQPTAHSNPRTLSTLQNNSKTGVALLSNTVPAQVSLPISKSGQATQPISISGQIDSSKITLAPGLILPSGITVSKVSNEKPTLAPNRKPQPGASMFMNYTLPARLPSSVTSSPQQIMQGGRRLASPIRPLIDQIALNVKSGLRAKVQNSIRQRRFLARPQLNHQARTFHLNSGLGPQLPTPNTARQSTIRQEQKESFVCRLCGDFGPSKWSFETKSDMLATIKFVFDLNIDVVKEKQFGISNRVCDVCFATMTASEILKRKAAKLQEATDNFIAQHQGAQTKEEPDDEIIFVSEKRVEITPEPDRTGKVANSNNASNGTINNQVMDKKTCQSETTSESFSGSEKNNSINSERVNLGTSCSDPGPEPFIPTHDPNFGYAKASDEVQSTQPEGIETMSQTNPDDVGPMETTDETTPATFTNDLSDFFFQGLVPQMEVTTEEPEMPLP